jgi:hypothetical protein
MSGKFNNSVGPPLKRLIAGAVYWQDEKIIRSWLRQLSAVRKHNREQRKLERLRKKEIRLEFERWRESR